MNSGKIRLTSRSLRHLALSAGLLELAGILEFAEVVRQRRRETGRSLVTSSADRDPASVRLLTLTWWPAGLAPFADLTAANAMANREHLVVASK